MTRPSFPQPTRTKRAFAYSTLAFAATLALGAGEASAFDIDTGNPDLAIRFDNTVRLNYGVRVESRDSKIGNSALSDEGDYSFDKDDAIAKRFDLLSEFDLVYKKRYGLRVSGAAWYDFAYDSGTSKSNPNAPLVNIPSYVGNQYSSTVKRLYRDGAEFLDAFVFGGVDLGDGPGAGQARPAHDLLGRIAAARRSPAQRLVRAGAARPAEGLRDPRHRSQGTVPAAEPAVDAGASHRHAVGGRPVHARVGVGALSGRRHLSTARSTSSSTARTGSSLPSPAASASPRAARPSEP